MSLASGCSGPRDIPRGLHGLRKLSLGTPLHPAFGAGTHVEEDGGRLICFAMQSGPSPRRRNQSPPVLEGSSPLTAACPSLEGRSGVGWIWQPGLGQYADPLSKAMLDPCPTSLTAPCALEFSSSADADPRDRSAAPDAGAALPLRGPEIVVEIPEPWLEHPHGQSRSRSPRPPPRAAPQASRRWQCKGAATPPFVRPPPAFPPGPLFPRVTSEPSCCRRGCGAFTLPSTAILRGSARRKG